MHWRPSPALVAAALILLAIPSSGATWSVAGSHEPDNPYDSASWMFPDAPQTPGKRVYFNAYSMMRSPAGLASGLNPNTPLLHTQNEAPVSEFHEAILGVWTDCNKDGYVGMAEGALREYKAELLFDASLCPPSSGDSFSWDGNHNYNGLVVELVPITRQWDADEDTAPEDYDDLIRYVDPEAAVWGDWHRPDERPFQRSCALAPQPRGTYQSSGGAINYVDCRADVLETFNLVVDTAGDPAELRFADVQDARSGPLGQIGTFGTEDESHSPVRVWDCDAEPALRSGDVLNATPVPATLGASDEEDVRDLQYAGHENYVYSLAANPVGDTDSPTAPALVNHTLEGADGDCDTSNDAGHDFYGNWATFYVGEEDFSGVDPNDKRQSNWNLEPTETSRRSSPPREEVPPIDGVHHGPTGASGNEGVNVLSPGGVRWSSTSIYVTKPGFQVVRTNVGGNPELAGAYWLSFYASLGSASVDQGLQLPGGSGVYGSPHCGANEAGIHNGWNCDASLWYINPDGSPMPDNGHLGRPGKVYTMRDVDCYDGSNDLGVGTQPSFYGTSPCP